MIINRVRSRPGLLRSWSVTCQAVILGILLLTASNQTAVFCIERSGVTTESVWALCCATTVPEERAGQFSQVPLAVAMSTQCERCLDVRAPFVGEPATNTVPEEPLPRQPRQAEPKCQASGDLFPQSEDQFGQAAAVGHNGSDLKAQRTVRLLT